MLKKIIQILRDELGIDPITTGALIMGGSTLLGGILGKNKQKTIDPYAKLRGPYQDYLLGKLGTSTPYKYNPEFELPQPEIEKQTEGVISNKLSNLPKMETDILGTTKKYYDAVKANRQLENEEDVLKQKNSYNRLGLMSSTPGMQAETDLRNKQNLQLGEFDAALAMDAIGKEYEGTRLYEDIANRYIDQGQVLGSKQREYSAYPIEMSMQDIMRMVEEEMGYAGMANSLLGSNPPETYFEPNIWSKLSGAGQDIGSMLMMSNILGGAGKGKVGGPNTTSQGIRVPSTFTPAR